MMNKSRKTSNLYNVVTYDDAGNIVVPAGVTLGTAPGSSDDSSKAATTAWIRTYVGSLSYATSASVSTAIANLVDAAPSTLDTLNELAAALGDDPNFATTITASIGTKVPQARTITINGTAYDLSADRSWTIAAGLTSFNTRTGAITLTSGDVTTALGFTPYNATNPSGYITGITSGNVTTALGYTPVTNARTLTINGTAYDLSADRSWTISGSDATKLPLAGGTMTGTPVFTAVYGNPGGDFTGITTPAYKVHVASGYWRIVYKSADATNSGVYNYETGKKVYWGEPEDTGEYQFRGRTLKWVNNSGTEYNVWHAGNLTNLNQLTNGPGYITGYTETDTLASVTGRGATTNTLVALSGKVTLGNRTSASFNGNVVGLTINNTAEIRSTGTENPPALTWHYEGLATRHILMTSAGVINVVSPSTENSGVAILAVNGNPVIHSGNIGSQSVSYASSAGSSHGISYDGNAISGMGPISNWDSRPGVGYAGFGINWHTGVSISGYPGYGGVRLYASGYPTHSTSVLRLEASGAVYTYGGLYSDGNAVIHAGNIGSQSVSYASTAGSADSIDGTGFVNTGAGGGQNADTIASNGISYVSAGISLLGQTDGAFYSQAYNVNWQHQVYGDYRTGQLAVRGKNSGTWQAWRTILDSSNCSSYVLALSGGTVTGVTDFGTDGGTDTGIGIRYANANSGYGRIRFYHSGTNGSTIHSFSPAWQGGTLSSATSGGINISGVTGTTFGDWNNCDAYIARGGNIWGRYDIIAYSDARVKENVTTILDPLEKINKIRGVTFTRNDHADKSRVYTGVIAQELLPVIPEVVNEDADGMYSVAYGNMAGLFIEAIKEQQSQIESQQSEIQELKDLVKQLLAK